jgi:hypothetical protein
MKAIRLTVALVIILGLAASARLQQESRMRQVQFAPPIIISSPQAFSSGIASGDFNNDGIPDLATVSSHNGVLNTALGNGDGTFQPWIYSLATYAPEIVALGKFDGPNLDAVVDDITSENADLLLGDGQGNFPHSKSIGDRGSQLAGIAIGDFNNDHNQDLAFIPQAYNNGVGHVYVRLGNGNGSFQPAKSYSTGGAYPRVILAGDFNGDGKIDLAIANSGSQTQQSSVAVLLGNGDGTFAAPIVFAFSAGYAEAMTAGDFNEDGKLDLAVSVIAQTVMKPLIILLGNGNGTFTARPVQESGIGPYSLATADFNGDGNLDLAGIGFGIRYRGYLVVLLGNGRGDFRAPEIFALPGRSPVQMTVADFNADGKPDVAVLNSDTPTIGILLNTSPFPALHKTRSVTQP